MAAEMMTKKSGGKDEASAAAALTAWMNDLTSHGPLTIESNVAKQRGDKWVAIATYREKK